MSGCLRLLLVIVLLGLIAPAAATDRPILALGDSLTYGIGGSGSSYPAVLEALSGRRVVNAGSPGDTTADGLARIDTSLASGQPALVLLCLGINDLLRQVPVQAIERNLEQLAARVDAAGARLVVIAVAAPGDATAHPLFARLALPATAVLDADALVALQSNPRWKADTVHLNAEGYRALAEGLLRHLDRD